MIHVETKGDSISVQLGDATGAKLIDEVSAAIVSVVMTVAGEAKNEDLKIMCVRDFYRNVVMKSAKVIEKKYGFNILDSDDEVDDDD